MKEVYILLCESSENCFAIEAVFSTREKAQEHMDYLEANNHIGWLHISKYILDKVTKFYDP